MKKIIIILFSLFIPLFLCVGCVASDTEIANSLDGNMTRLVYSVGYLDSISQTEMTDLIQNTSYFGGVSALQNSNVGLTSLKENGFRTSVFNNSLAENSLNSTPSNNTLVNATNFEQTENWGDGDYGIATLPLLDDEYPVAESLNSGNATQSELGGLYAENGVCGLETEQNLNSYNSSAEFSNLNNGSGIFNNGNLNNCYCNNASGYNLNQYNGGILNGGSNLNSNQNSLLSVATEDSELAGSTEGVVSTSSVDTSLLLTSASDLNEILMLISQKRGIIMLYCTDLRAGKGALSADEKEAITEYIAIIKETTNYLNTYSSTLTTYMNNIKTIAYTENAQELINAKLIRANEILKTRYAKLDTCIDSLDAIIAILQRAIGMDYVTNYSFQNNTTGNSQTLNSTNSVNLANEEVETLKINNVNENLGTANNNLNENYGIVTNNLNGNYGTATNNLNGNYGTTSNLSGNLGSLNTINGVNSLTASTAENNLQGINSCNSLNNTNNLNGLSCGITNNSSVSNSSFNNLCNTNSNTYQNSENIFTKNQNCPYCNNSLLINENQKLSNNLNNNSESLLLNPSSNTLSPNVLPENNKSILINNSPNLTTEEILNGYPATSPITTPNPTNIISSVETSTSSFDIAENFADELFSDSEKNFLENDDKTKSNLKLEYKNSGDTFETSDQKVDLEKLEDSDNFGSEEKTTLDLTPTKKTSSDYFESNKAFQNVDILKNKEKIEYKNAKNLELKSEENLSKKNENLNEESFESELPVLNVLDVHPIMPSDKSLLSKINLLPIVKEQDTVKTLPYYPQFN